MTLIQRRLNVDATSWRRCIDVEPTLCKCHVPAGYLPKIELWSSEYLNKKNII